MSTSSPTSSSKSRTTSSSSPSSRSKRHSHETSILPSPVDLLPSHSDPRERPSRKDRERRSGGFDWGDGIALALIGAVTVFSVDKALESRRERKKNEGSVSDAESVAQSEQSRRIRPSRTWAHDDAHGSEPDYAPRIRPSRTWAHDDTHSWEGQLEPVEEETRAADGEDWAWYYEERGRRKERERRRV